MYRMPRSKCAVASVDAVTSSDQSRLRRIRGLDQPCFHLRRFSPLRRIKRVQQQIFVCDHAALVTIIVQGERARLIQYGNLQLLQLVGLVRPGHGRQCNAQSARS